MKEFANIPMFIAFTSSLVVELDHLDTRALHRAGRRVVKEARRVLGTYDYGWKPLAASTLTHKDNDTPLLETEELRDSIHYTVSGREFQVGSDLPKALWQELGTVKIPARSFLAGAMHHEAATVAHNLGGTLINHIASSKVVALADED